MELDLIDSISIGECQKFFPSINKGIYADTAAMGLISEPLIQWRNQHDLELLSKASGLWPQHTEILRNTRETIKRFFHAEDAGVALLPNFSIGLNLLLEKLDPGLGVLLFEQDYPSVNWPFENRGFNITYVQSGHNLEEQIRDKLNNKDIDILAISLIQWLNGILIEPDFFRKLKEEFPSLIIIADGTQYCGAFDLDFANSGIDVLGSSGYKWLLGGYGNGFMIIADSFVSRFEISSIGFNSAEGNLDAKDSVPFHKQLEPGHLDSLNFGSLGFSMDLLTKIGTETVENHNRKLSVYAMRHLADLGLLEKIVMERNRHGTIFWISAKRYLFEHLLKNNIRCSWRNEGIRLSFHFYNTESEIERIVHIIKKAI